MEKKSKTVLDRIWDFLASVKLAVVLFALIALTSIVGTIIEQQAPFEKNILVIEKLFGKFLAPTLYRVFETLGFMDMYHSWWFVALLGLFSANILICSLDRFPRIWKTVREPQRPLEEEHFKSAQIRRALTIKGNLEKAKDKVVKAFKSAGFNFSESKEAHGYQIYTEKGKFSRLGVYITHLSVLLIFIGAVIGVYFGFKGGLNLPEGTDSAVAYVRTSLSEIEIKERNTILTAMEASNGSISQASQKLRVSEEHLRTRMKRVGIMPLDFAVRCEDFDVEFYGNSDMPKEFKSLLTIIDGGKEVVKKWITVNDPLKYKGVSFYQSSYGAMDNLLNMQFKFKVTSAAGLSETLSLHQADKFSIPNTNIEVEVMDFSPALSMDATGRAFTYAEMMQNPAALLKIKDGKDTYMQWSFKRRPDTWLIKGGHAIELIDIWGAQYTGLQVRQDPGVWMVYLGCIIMSIGLYVAFFMSHRKLWLRLTQEKGNTKADIAASVNKNRPSLERRIDKIESVLREGGK
ncbi:MAG: cytochrome c biogenesis protein ResB [Nitrospirae bacterium]|nr:cytochrome c biogenesis protein ResB [Nitrospirota bacterium]